MQFVFSSEHLAFFEVFLASFIDFFIEIISKRMMATSDYPRDEISSSLRRRTTS